MQRGKRSGALLVPAGLLACLALLLAGCGGSTGPQPSLGPNGGLRVTLQATCLPTAPGCDVSKQRDEAVSVLSRRLSQPGGVAGSAVQTDGQSGVVVELPGVSDIASVHPLLTSIGALAFVDSAGQPPDIGTNISEQLCASTCGAGQYKIVFTGTQLDHSQTGATQDRSTSRWVVLFEFAGDTRNQFGQYTRDHIGHYLTITLDGVVIEAAIIQSEIDGQGEIIDSDAMTQLGAQQLAAMMISGPLPVALSVASTQMVAPPAASASPSAG